MNITHITPFGGAAHMEASDLHDDNVSLSIEEFLATVLGPKQLEGPLLIPVTVFYVLVFLTGLAGNLSVCAVIAKNKSMHSAMNYYLISLAISDLAIIILGLPNELSIYWHQYPFPFGETFCKLRSFISETSSYASVLTIMAFSLERYLAICHPLYVLPLSDQSRVSAVSSLCWLVAMLFSLPHLLFTKLNYLDYPWQSGNFLPESAFCALLDDNIFPKWYPVHEISFIVFFLIPVILLTYLYLNMGLVIRASARAEIRRSVHRQSNGAPTDNRQQIIRMLIAVVLLFFISWAPFHVQRLGYVYFKESPWFRSVNEHLFYVSGCLYFLSSTLNPVLYNIMSAKYREAFKATFCCWLKGQPERSRIPTWATQTSTTTLISTTSERRRESLEVNANRRLGRLERKCGPYEHMELNGGLTWGPRGEVKYFEKIIEEKEDVC